MNKLFESLPPEVRRKIYQDAIEAKHWTRMVEFNNRMEKLTIIKAQLKRYEFPEAVRFMTILIEFNKKRHQCKDINDFLLRVVQSDRRWHRLFRGLVSLALFHSHDHIDFMSSFKADTTEFAWTKLQS